MKSKVRLVMSCEGPCQNVWVTLTTSSGDADFYASLDRPPIINDRTQGCDNCLWESSISQARETDLLSFDSTWNSDIYVTVRCAEMSGSCRNGLVTFSGLNLKNVQFY